MNKEEAHKKKYITSYHQDSTADHYENIFHYDADKVIHQLELNATTKALKRVKNKNNYLDIACGFGRILNLYAKHFKHRTGIDSSPVMLKKARRHTAKNTKLVIGDASKLPFKNNSFDFITCFRFIMNFKAPIRQRMINEAARVLTPGGTLVYNLHKNTYGFRGLYSIIRNTILRRDEPHLSYRKLTHQLETAGLTIETVTPIKLLPYWRGYTLFTKTTEQHIEGTLNNLPLARYYADGLIITCTKK